MTKIKGGEQLCQRILDELEAIRHFASLSESETVFNPRLGYQRFQHIINRALALEGVVRGDLAAMLQRAESNRDKADLPNRVMQLEARIDQLETAITDILHQ